MTGRLSESSGLAGVTDDVSTVGAEASGIGVLLGLESMAEDCREALSGLQPLRVIRKAVSITTMNRRMITNLSKQRSNPEEAAR